MPLLVVGDPERKTKEPWKRIRISGRLYNYLVDQGSYGESMNDLLEWMILPAPKKRKKR